MFSPKAFVIILERYEDIQLFGYEEQGLLFALLRLEVNKPIFDFRKIRIGIVGKSSTRNAFETTVEAFGIPCLFKTIIVNWCDQSK